MTKKMGTMALILCFMLSFASCNHSYQKRTDNIKQSLVTVVATYPNHHNFSMGSVISANNILTTAHIFDSEYEKQCTSIYFYINQTKYDLALVSIDSHNDLALLSCNYQFDHTINYVQKNINNGDTVFLVSDNITSHMPTKASVLKKSQTIDYDTYSRDLISISTNATNGHSGAPIVTTNGYAIAILSAKHAEDSSSFFAIPAHTINDFLYSAKQHDE